jgi:hypothetical protein
LRLKSADSRALELFLATPVHSSSLSELDQKLAELTDTRPNDTMRGTDSGGVPEIKKTSKYKTWLGEDYMRTVIMTYSSEDGIAPAAFFSCSRLFWEPISFPITMTKTDVLLLRRT